MPPVRPTQFTLYHFSGYAYGRAAFLLARLAGAADLFIVPIAQLALKAGWRCCSLGGLFCVVDFCFYACTWLAEGKVIWLVVPNRTSLVSWLQSFAERSALASPAARALNIGMLLASLIHTAVELRMMEGGWAGMGAGMFGAEPVCCKWRRVPARRAATVPGTLACLHSLQPSSSPSQCTSPGAPPNLLPPAGAPAGFLLPVNLSTWVFAGLASAASLVAGGRPADLVAEMKEVAEGVKKRE